jgi:fatty acid amide hydrolase 2
VFNLLGLPVTQVPLGLNRRGLPLGVQVAAADGNDHLTIAAALELERRFGGWVWPGG